MTLNEKAQQMDTVAKAAPLNADLRALHLVYSNVDVPIAPPDALVATLVCLQAKVRAARPANDASSSSSRDSSSEHNRHGTCRSSFNKTNKKMKFFV